MVGGEGGWVWIVRCLEHWPDWVPFCVRWTAVGGFGAKEEHSEFCGRRFLTVAVRR